MTTSIITEQVLDLTYLATAGQTTFSFGFQIFNGTSDLKVMVNTVETTAYNLALVGEEGGTITLTTPATLNDTVQIQRSLRKERVTQFPNAGPVPMASVNHELNRIVALVQGIDTEASLTSVGLQTGTAYTATITDANSYIRFSNAAAVGFTVPPNATVPFPIGTVIEIEQAGLGAVTVIGGAGVTINSRGGDLTLAGQFSTAALRKVRANEWTLNGDL